ncbi:MAG: hypothetical protein Q9219_007702 [cf. Caloplaca sp. 3 TL-2023]
MGITLVLLASALKPTGYVPAVSGSGYVYTSTPAQMKTYVSSPATCLFHRYQRVELAASLSKSDSRSSDLGPKEPPYNLGIILISLAYLVTGYIVRIVRIFRPVAQTAETWLRVAPLNILCTSYESARNGSRPHRFATRLQEGILLVFITIYEAFCEIANSMLWEIFWLAAALVWGTLKVIAHRQQSYLADENTWGFGQILALLLSVIPFWSFVSSLQEHVQQVQSADTRVTTVRVVEGIGSLDSHSWFKGLIGFVFGTAVIYAGGTIYAFAVAGLLTPTDIPGTEFTGQASDVLSAVPGFVVVVYIVAGSCSILVAMLFTALTLAFHFRLKGSRTVSAWCRFWTRDWSDLSRRRVRQWAWIFIVLLLLVIQLVVLVLVFVWGQFSDFGDITDEPS